MQFYVLFPASFGRYVFYLVVRGCESGVNVRLHVSKELMIDYMSVRSQ